MSAADILREVYSRLLARFGPQHWWPGDSRWEMMVGAVLTQAVSWTNVERAIANLKSSGALSPPALRRLPPEELARLIRPAGYYNVKARKLKALAQLMGDAGDDLSRLFNEGTDGEDTGGLRRRLLGVYGVGEETADSILLYAASRPVFVIDAYTRRIMGRLGLAPPTASNSELQRLFMDHLPPDAALYNEYHALLVHLGKNTCRKTPLCPACPLNTTCPFPEVPGR
jgi:endonuclease-3 related protein